MKADAFSHPCSDLSEETEVANWIAI